jgi:hypothetical protein
MTGSLSCILDREVDLYSVVSFAHLREDLHPLDLLDEVGAPLRLSIVCAPAVGALSLGECRIFLPLAIPRVVLLSAEEAVGLVGTGASYVSIFLAVVALADTRSTVI